jgi:hypothetical protein
MARLVDRSKKSGHFGGSRSGDSVSFDSTGVAEGVSAAKAVTALFENPSVFELGHPGVDVDETVAGNATATKAVPAGKYWRLIGAHHTLVTDATVANRAVVYTINTNEEVITHANVAASTTARRQTLFGTDDYIVGNEAVAAQGTLTIAEPVTAADTFTINGVTFTFVAALTGAVNEIFIGANEAATKVALNAAFAGRVGGGTLHSVSDAVYTSLEMTAAAFVADDMVFTANVAGTLGDALEFVEATLTHASNVLDGTGTLGGTTAGVDAADEIGTLDYPTQGVYLGPAEEVVVSVTNGVAGDALHVYLFYLEFDADPTP